ncbi:hypothetical protein JB92DRAFT_2883920 [Gautieria morchelliformis]|nr:hypothetical protein JB92DRAFT_2883920 [Gautieria morchelliformis]
MCSATAVTVINVRGLVHRQVLSRPGPFLSGCFGSLPNWYYTINIPPLFTTCLLVILTLYKTLQAMRCAGSTRGMPLIAIFFRDGLLNFSAVAAMLVINILLFRVARITLASLGTGFLIVVPCISGSRLFLNVRQKLLHPDLTTTIPMESFEMRPLGPPTVVVTDLDEMP